MPPETHYAPCGELSTAYQVIGKAGFLWPVEQLWYDPGYHRLMQGLNDFARVIVYDKRGTFRGTGCPVVPSLRERTPPPRR